MTTICGCGVDVGVGVGNVVGIIVITAGVGTTVGRIPGINPLLGD